MALEERFVLDWIWALRAPFVSQKREKIIHGDGNTTPRGSLLLLLLLPGILQASGPLRHCGGKRPVLAAQAQTGLLMPSLIAC